MFLLYFEIFHLFKFNNSSTLLKKSGFFKENICQNIVAREPGEMYSFQREGLLDQLEWQSGGWER